MKVTAMMTAAVAATALMITRPPATTGADEYLGEIMMVGFNFCPRGTVPAEGQTLPIAQFSALFSLYGTIYGGDGRTTFAVPDLRGRVPMGQGNGPGLDFTPQGQRLGDPVQSGTGARTTPTLTVRYCVVAQGTFPSRS